MNVHAHNYMHAKDLEMNGTAYGVALNVCVRHSFFHALSVSVCTASNMLYYTFLGL